jgi:hypothetical protein
MTKPNQKLINQNTIRSLNIHHFIPYFDYIWVTVFDVVLQKLQLANFINKTKNIQYLKIKIFSGVGVISELYPISKYSAHPLKI